MFGLIHGPIVVDACRLPDLDLATKAIAGLTSSI